MLEVSLLLTKAKKPKKIKLFIVLDVKHTTNGLVHIRDYADQTNHNPMGYTNKFSFYST